MIFSRLTNSRILLSLLILGLIVSTQAEPKPTKTPRPEHSQSTIAWTSAGATITGGVDKCCFSRLCQSDQDRCYGYHHRIDSNKSRENILRTNLFEAGLAAICGLMVGTGMLFCNAREGPARE
ncbi:hypothetical protein EAF04_007954 [Stromatinia cepivora]|nr:hypothetical protein EAF04_007954 [Stromatinia cepivora]